MFKDHMKELKKDIMERQVLGKVIGFVYVVEFQKRYVNHIVVLNYCKNLSIR